MNLTSVKSFFSLHETVVLTGFTKYMLDYLTREQIFAPTNYDVGRRGVRRQYSYSDVVLLRALFEVCAKRGKVRYLKGALQEFRQDFGSMKPGQRIDKQLFIQGDELCVYTSSKGGMQLRSGQFTFSFVIDLSVVSRHVADCVEVASDGNCFKLTEEVANHAETERQRIWQSIKRKRAV